MDGLVERWIEKLVGWKYEWMERSNEERSGEAMEEISSYKYSYGMVLFCLFYLFVSLDQGWGALPQ